MRAMAGAAMAVLVALGGIAQQAGMAEAGKPLSAKDREFVMKAAAGGMLEVQLGGIAMTNAASPAVKAFGQMMVRDHSKVNDQLMAIAKRKGVTVEKTLPQEQMAVRTRLAALRGADFDKAYMAEMVSDHEKDLADYKRAATESEDAELKQFAAGVTPSLQQHLEHARDTREGLSTSP